MKTRKFEDLTIGQEMVIFGILGKADFTPVESAKYVKNIRRIGKNLKLNVFAIWTVQRKFVETEVKAVIKQLIR